MISKVRNFLKFLKYFSSTSQPIAFQNVSWFVFQQCLVFNKATIQNVYNVYYFNTLSMCILNAVKKQSGIGFIADALFGSFACLHNLYTIVELHTNFVLIHSENQSSFT